MAGEIILKNSTLERSSDGTTWTQIPDVTSLTIPEPAVEQVETTSIDTTGTRTFIPGLTDNPAWTFTQKYTSAAITQFQADENVPLQYRLTLDSPDGGVTSGDVWTISQATRSGAPTLDDIGQLVGISNTLTIGAKAVRTPGA